MCALPRSLRRMIRLLNAAGVRSALALLALVLSALLIAGCGGGGDDEPVAAADTVATTSALQEVQGRSVSGSDTEIVLRTADGERTFLVREEDRAAVDPEHFVSHAGVPTLGFTVFYVTEADGDYAVSVEEIAGSTLGFD